MTWLALPLHALLIYAFLLLLLRLSGRRALNQSSAFDVVLALVLSSVASAFAFGQITAAAMIAATGSLLALHLAAHLLAHSSDTAASVLGLGAAGRGTTVDEAQEQSASAPAARMP
jgi:uncharacterized membrane protein YcaP (DUF421 family)